VLRELEQLGFRLRAGQPLDEGLAKLGRQGLGIEAVQLGGNGRERQVEHKVEQGLPKLAVLGLPSGVGQDGSEALGEVIDGRVGELTYAGAELPL
jgi:hypothetical protein